MFIQVGGIEHEFFEPSPREIDALIRMCTAPLGEVSVKEVFEGEVTTLFHANGWEQRCGWQILQPELLIGATVSSIVQAEQGISPALVGPVWDEASNNWIIRMFTPRRRRL